MSAPVASASIGIIPPGGALSPAPTTFCGRIMQVFDPDCWEPGIFIAKIVLVAATFFTVFAGALLATVPVRQLITFCFSDRPVAAAIVKVISGAALGTIVSLAWILVAYGVGFYS